MNYWILQSNPNKYRQTDYIKAHWNETDTWAISRYVNEIEIGDIAFIWLSNEKGENNRGIYAMAKIVDLPILDRPLEWEDPYWIDREEQKRLFALPRLALQYIKPIIDKPLFVEELKIADLQGLPILRMPQRSIYKLTGEEGEKIKSIIELR
jgi:predicted RNA-binding protein with PUA-like domain